MAFLPASSPYLRHSASNCVRSFNGTPIGDGWIDILMEKKNRIEVTPVTRAGFQNQRKWRRKIPAAFRDPDQIYGRDLNGDGKAEFVLMKLEGGQTRLTVLEGSP